MAVKVYIHLVGEKNGGCYEIEKFPVEQESGLLNVRYTPSKGKSAGMKKPMQIAISRIERIELAGETADYEPDFGNVPE